MRGATAPELSRSSLSYVSKLLLLCMAPTTAIPEGGADGTQKQTKQSRKRL